MRRRWNPNDRMRRKTWQGFSWNYRFAIAPHPDDWEYICNRLDELAKVVHARKFAGGRAKILIIKGKHGVPLGFRIHAQVPDYPTNAESFARLVQFASPVIVRLLDYLGGNRQRGADANKSIAEFLNRLSPEARQQAIAIKNCNDV